MEYEVGDYVTISHILDKRMKISGYIKYIDNMPIPSLGIVMNNSRVSWFSLYFYSVNYIYQDTNRFCDGI